MSFDTVTFWAFFAVVLALWHRLSFSAAKSVGVLASLVFYGWWNPWYLPLLVLSSITDYVAGGKIHASSVASHRRRWLVLSLVINLGLLAFFKYTPFVVNNAAAVGRMFGAGWEGGLTDWVVPVGISFYTFQTLSYTLDVHAGRLTPCRSFRDFLLYVSFFPQLVAGPIVRARELLPQLENRRRPSAARVQLGLYYAIWGLCMKIVVADNLAPAVNRAFSPGNVETLSPGAAWLGAVYFHTQIFADFAGYSAIAIGLAHLLGMRFPRNFNAPYIAVSLSDFWNRWHITLSSWLRDYLYFSLGGNRQGRKRTLVNLLLTMAIGGLWHGAIWTFVAWGVLHGIGLCVERSLPMKRRLTAAPAGIADALGRLVRMGVVGVFVLVTWVLFRAQDFGLAATYLQRMFVAPFTGVGEVAPIHDWRYVLLLFPVAAVHLYQLGHEWFGWKKSASRRAILAAVFLLLLTVVYRGKGSEFIYFQF